ncbi:MAG: DUF4124 domain-containing protein, partial [Casimicrobiaceae bacterium]
MVRSDSTRRRTRSGAGALALLGAVLLSLSVNAAVFKCVATDGSVEYRDTACEGKSGGELAVNPNVVSPIDQTANRAADRAL